MSLPAHILQKKSNRYAYLEENNFNDNESVP